MMSGLLMFARSPLVLALLITSSAACNRIGNAGRDVRGDNAQMEQRADFRRDQLLLMCNVDFPCKTPDQIMCIGPAQYRKMKSFDCHHTCGPGPCSGGSCEPDGPVLDCPPGQKCVSGPYYDGHCASPDGGATKGDLLASPSDASVTGEKTH